MDATGNRGSNSGIDAVGPETHGTTINAITDRIKVANMLAMDRIHVLHQASQAVQKKRDHLSIAALDGKFPSIAVRIVEP